MKNLLLSVSLVMALMACKKSTDKQSLNRDASTSSILKDLSIDSAIDLSQEFLATDYRKTGGFIKKDSAIKKLERGRGIGNALNQPYGFVFGLDSLDKFLKNMQAVNKLYPDTIHAVRVYLVKTHRKAVSPPYRRYEHFDVMMVPIVSNGSNFFDLGDVVDSLAFVPDFPGILNNSLPCPDECP